MQDMAKSISFRWDDDFKARIDAARGLIPRSAYVRAAIEAKMAHDDDARKFAASVFDVPRRFVGPSQADEFVPADSVTLETRSGAVLGPVVRGGLSPFAGAGSPVDLERHVQVSPKLTTAGIRPQPKGKP